jgi:hypothetical protein
MTWRPHGKYINVSESNIEALGVCDYSGFHFERKDLIKQMEWRGNALVWTGFLVGRPFLDEANDQLRPPILPPDPVPVIEPRTQQDQVVTWNNNLIGLVWNELDTYVWNAWSSFTDGVQQISEQQKLQDLQSYNWGAG